MYFNGYSETAFVYDSVSSSADHSTASTSYELMDSMTRTPVNGTYMVWFNTNVVSSTSNIDTYISIFVGGVQVSDSERFIEENNTTDQSTMSTMALVTVDGSQAIEIRWKVTAGFTTAHAKTMMILKVS